MGRLVSGYLAGQTGLPITVDRARVDGSRLTLIDVRLRPSVEFPVDMHVTRLDVDGGLLPLVLPAGGAVAVTVASVSIGVESRGAGRAPDARMLDTLRATVRSWLARPGTLTVRVPGGELRVGGRSYRIDLTGDKSARGELTLGLGRSIPGQTAARVGVRAVADGEHHVTLGVEATGERARLGVPWPSLVQGTLQRRSKPGCFPAVMSPRPAGSDSGALLGQSRWTSQRATMAWPRGCPSSDSASRGLLASRCRALRLLRPARVVSA